MNGFKASIHKFPSKTEFNHRTMEALDSMIADKAEFIKRDDIKSFVKLVGSKGCTFCPSTFLNGRKSRNTFEQSQLFVLYFDSLTSPGNSGLEFEIMRDRACQYELPVFFAYDVFSTSHHNKFCLVFLNNTAFRTWKEAEAIQKALMMIFPESDKSCSVLTLYKGGNKVLYFDDAMPEINADLLFMNMSLYLKNRYGDTNYKRKIVEFSRQTGIRLNQNKFPDVSFVECKAEDICKNIDDKNSPIPIIEINRFGEKLSYLNYHIHFEDSETDHVDDEMISIKKTPFIHRSYRSDLLQSLSSNCNLYQEFLSGKKKLSQRELFGIATNLVQIESGKKEFKSILRSKLYYNGAKKKYDNWDFYFYYIKNREPNPCASFCPYHDICPHGKTILSTTKPKYHQVERIAGGGGLLYGLDEAWEDFRQKFEWAVTSDKQCWHIIKCQTALGKTQAVLELLRDTHQRVLIAVPTNKLKREVYERAEKMGISMAVSPSLHELEDELPEIVWDEIQALYDAGKSPMFRVNQAIAEDDPACAGVFKKYKKELEEFDRSDGHAITTHRRLTNMDVSQYDLVIIDEDIIYSTVIPSRETVSVRNMIKLKKKLTARDPLAVKIKKILKQIKTSEFFNLNKTKYDKTYADIKIPVNIPALCLAECFCYRKETGREEDAVENCISFIRNVKFQKNKKYIMLSATADKDICEYYLGEDQVEFYNCKEAAFTGVLNQYADKTMSRSFMDENPDIINRIKQWTGFKHTISFKKFDACGTDGLHFGNCAGSDSLKNENIDVIGTPHQPEWIYKLFAFSLGYDVEAQIKPNAIVTHNGYRFRFTTYEDEILRAIQFYMIESELEQAVGRARLLRCCCTVNLFSNFPLKQAVLKESEYDDGQH